MNEPLFGKPMALFWLDEVGPSGRFNLGDSAVFGFDGEIDCDYTGGNRAVEAALDDLLARLGHEGWDPIPRGKC